MKKYFFFVLVLFIWTKGYGRETKFVANPGLGICKEDWIKNVQNNFSVRFDREYLDVNGNVIPSPNPRPFCSGSLARVGPEQKLKIISASHCASEKNREAPNGQFYFPEGDVPRGAPPNARSARIVARIAGKDPAIPITSFYGPKLISDPRRTLETWRKNDFVLMDSNAVDLESIVAGKKVPSVCDSTMTKNNIEKAAVVGFGVTNTNSPSLTPLCGEQKINSINNNIIAIAPYTSGTSGACPGDSGGGLWVKPKGSESACLTGVVSGPRATGHAAPLQTGTAPPAPPTEIEQKEAAFRSCTTPGVEAIFASVYQTDLTPYIQSDKPVSEIIPNAESAF